MSESKMDIRIAHARMRADLMEKILASGTPLVRVDVEALVNSLREMLGYLGEAGPLPPEPTDEEIAPVFDRLNSEWTDGGGMMWQPWSEVVKPDAETGQDSPLGHLVRGIAKHFAVRGGVPAPPPDLAIREAITMLGALDAELQDGRALPPREFLALRKRLSDIAILLDGVRGEAGPPPPSGEQLDAFMAQVCGVCEGFGSGAGDYATVRAALHDLLRGVVPAPPPAAEAVEAAAHVVGKLAVHLGGEAFSFDRMPEDSRYWAAKILEAGRAVPAPQEGDGLPVCANCGAVQLRRKRAVSSEPSPAALEQLAKHMALIPARVPIELLDTNWQALLEMNPPAVAQFRMRAKAALHAVDRGASAPPAPSPEGPWKVTTRRDADGDHWGVDREPEVGVNWYHGGFATEAEALAVRDALNRVAGGASSPVPAPTEERARDG